MRVTSVQGLMHSYASLTGYIVHLGTEEASLLSCENVPLSFDYPDWVSDRETETFSNCRCTDKKKK